MQTAKHVITFSLFLMSIWNSALCQIPSTSAPNYILRQDDFVNRRETSAPVNFARQYFNAQQKEERASNSLLKAEDEWTPIGPFGKERLAGMGRINSMQFHPTDTNTWYICVAQGGLWKTTNSGQSWISISGDLPILRTSSLAVHPTNPDTMYVALGDFAYLGHNLQANENKRNSHYGLGIYKSTDGGVHWNPTGLSFAQTDFEGSLIAKIIMHKSDPNKLIAVGQTGAYVTSDGGQNWAHTHSGLFWDLEQHPTNKNALIASTGYVHSYGYGFASVLQSDNFGQSWTFSNIPVTTKGNTQRIELAYAPSDPSIVYAIACDSVGGFFGFYRSANGGVTFTQVYKGSYNLLGWYFNSDPGGQGRYDLAICVDRNDANKVLIGGVNIWQTKNGGISFDPVSYWALNYQHKSVHADIHELIQHPTGSSFFACHDGGLSRTFNVIPDQIKTLQDDRESSTQWVHYTNNLNITSFYRLAINPKNSKELTSGAQDNSTVFTNGSGFVNLSGGDGMESVFDTDDQYCYTSSQYGTIYPYFKSGNTYYYDGYRLYPPVTERAEWTVPMAYANNLLYVLYGNLYTAYGSDFVSVLSSFDKMPGFNYSHPGTALAVQKLNGQRIYVGKRGYASIGIDNEILTSSDGGGKWTSIRSGLPADLYPSYLEMNQSNPNQVWITFSGFDSSRKIFTSTDAGQQWINITYDLPNIPVNCIAHQNDGGGTVYIGTDLGVYYLEKDSIHWTFFSEGLPKVIVSELEINETNKTLVAATFGRGLWEIGLHNFIVGVRHPTIDWKMSATPNPVSKELTVQISMSDAIEGKFILVDVMGKVVLSTQINESLSFQTNYDVSHLLPGMYYAIITDGVNRKVLKVVKM